MAIQTNFITKHGLALTSAYIRVSYFHGDKEKMAIEYAVYPSKALRELNKDAVEVRHIEVALDLEFNGNPFKFAYAQLKKMDEFQEALDV